MSISFSFPEEGPYGCLHPSKKYAGFTEGESYWGTVTQYVLGQRTTSKADLQQIRMADDGQSASALLARMQTKDGWQEEVHEALKRGLYLAFEMRLSWRAVLIDTGDEPIAPALTTDELGMGLEATNALLGRALEAVRSDLRARALDVNAVQCRHQTAENIKIVCEHMLRAASPYHRFFTGIGGDYHLLCQACARALPTSPPLRKLCGNCQVEMLGRKRDLDIGHVAFPVRSTSLHFEHTRIQVPGVLPADVIARVGIRDAPEVWVMLERFGNIHRVDLSRGCASLIGKIHGSDINLDQAVTVVAADDGSVLAVAETFGRAACVVDGATGKVMHRLQRDDYHPEQCSFPIAFFRHHGQLRLLHATEWNRLDVSDPISGQLLTARSSPGHAQPTPPHYLDYFHAGVLVSPDGHHVIDDGWFWHPVGIVISFSLARWLSENVWESEDGPSRRTLADRTYFWDGPKCWLDDHTAAIWGIGDDDLELLPGVHIVDVVTGSERTILGPAAGLACVPPYLVSFHHTAGTAVWDVQTGERLAKDGAFCPAAQHGGTRAFLSVDGDSFVVTRLR